MQTTLARVSLILLAALSVFGFFHEQLYTLHVWESAGLSRFLTYAGIWTVISVGLVWRWPNGLPLVTSTAAVAWAAWWAGPLAPLAVLYFLASSWAVGRTLSSESDGVTAVILGAGVWSVVLWVALHFPVNYWWVYALALAAPLALARLRFSWPSIERRDAVGLALLLGLLGVNFFAALKPEISADGLSMHLALPASVAREGLWAFDHRAEIWTLMPAGADALFTGVYLLGGEDAAKLLNFAFLVLTALLVARTARRWTSPGRAYFSAALFASTPLVLLVTGSLFVENVWAAMLLAAAVALLDGRHATSAALAAIAVTVKLIAAAFAAPLLLLAFVWSGSRRWLVVALGAVALLPYGFAYVKSGNPIFPFANALFRSPDYHTDVNFTDARFAGLRPSITTPYELTFQSARYIEGDAGAAGFQYLWLVLPAALLARKRDQWVITGVAFAGAAIVLIGAPNLRYLYGAMPLASLMMAWSPWVEWGVAALALNLWFLPAAGYYDREFALFRKADIAPYLTEHEPLRPLIDRLNREAPGQAVAMFSAHATAGLIGRAYTDSWHNEHSWKRIREAEKPADIAAYLRELGVHYVVGPTNRRALFDVVQRFQELWLDPVTDGVVGTFTLYKIRDAERELPKDTRPLGPGMYDDREPRIEYSGPWFHDNQFSEPYNGTLSYSDVKGAAATLTFEGHAITYGFTAASNRGIAEVWLDGTRLRIVNLNSKETRWRSSARIVVTAGVHRLELRVGGRFVDLDSVTIE